MSNQQTAQKNGYIVWIDCEMTGLEYGVDELVEIAVVITDSELTPVAEGIDLIIKPSQKALDNMGEFVRNMHATSGLLPLIETGIPVADAGKQVLEYIKQYVPEPKKAPLAGNSIGTDKSFLEVQMPELVEHLHYRVIDVSSIKELARRWYPRVYFNTPEKNGGHRALNDILESIEELKYYRQTLFVPAPGMETDEIKTIAEQISAESLVKAPEQG